jgi:ankyrin repeat protein
VQILMLRVKIWQCSSGSSFKGNETIVKLLLKAGANVKAQGGIYDTALQAAAYKDNETIVKLLLKADANVNSQGGYYGNALQAAARQDHKAMFNSCCKTVQSSLRTGTLTVLGMQLSTELKRHRKVGQDLW